MPRRMRGFPLLTRLSRGPASRRVLDAAHPRAPPLSDCPRTDVAPVSVGLPAATHRRGGERRTLDRRHRFERRAFVQLPEPIREEIA
jgi:hypothetical protein